MPPLFKSQIFYDASLRRWRFLKIILIFVLIFFFSVSSITIASFLIRSPLPEASLELEIPKNNSDLTSLQINSEQSKIIQQNAYANYDSGIFGEQARAEQPALSEKSSLFIGYYVNWDENSFISLKNNFTNLDILMPEWLHLENSSGSVLLDDPYAQSQVVAFVRQKNPNLAIVPLINNFNPQSQNWDSASLVQALANPESRQKLIDNIENYIVQENFSGISIDFEEIPVENQPLLVKFMQELYARLHPQGLKIFMNIPLSNPDFDAKKLSLYSDYLILMAYDENSPGATLAGPVASQKWYENYLALRFQEIPSAKYIVALGNYGYDWKNSVSEAESLTFQNSMELANQYGGKIDLDPISLNPYFNYQDSAGQQRQIWFLDAATFFNQKTAADKIGKPAGFALWRLGAEDTSLWKINSVSPGNSPSEALKEFSAGYDLTYRGQGEILKITGTPKTGERSVSFDGQKNLITQEEFISLPSNYTISRLGGNDPKKIALTFDDGPDPRYTPRVLGILEYYKIPATFFLIGISAEKNPEIVQNAFAQGDELGNHTYSHPNIEKVSLHQAAIELNATQRIIEGLTGRKSLLFRPPYALDVEPESVSHMAPLALATKYGYYTTAMHIDPQDWNGLTAAEIANRVITDVSSGKGNIILLHDGGGNREETIKALPKIIKELKKQGFEFTTVSGLAGKSRDDLMPPISGNEATISGINQISFFSFSWLSFFLIFIFWTATFLGGVRFFFISILASIHSFKSKKTSLMDAKPSICVIVPAYNEDQVIVRTIGAILRSHYSNYEVIVVDDGSIDATFEIAKLNFGNNPKVRIYRRENAGKSEALNFAIALTTAKIIVTLDADTILKEDALEKLAAPFSDEKIGAVAGNAKVGNRVNLLTRWQALEYISQQNLDKRASDVINSITVVPGSVGAWRKKAILSAGGFATDTLAEDANLTLSIIRKGYRVIYAPDAIGYTEAPESVKNFLKQRFRWMYGTLQAVWKHRDIMWSVKYRGLGLFAIPNILIFQILFALISPVMDVMIILSLLWNVWQRHNHPLDYQSVNSLGQLGLFYLIFLGVDIAIALIAFSFERKEDWKLIIWVPLQRFFYRQLMYYVAIKTIFTALKGKLIGWNKFERRASVQAIQQII